MVEPEFSLNVYFEKLIFIPGNSRKGYREMSSRLFVTLYTLSIYLSAHKQLRQYLPNPLHEFPCIWTIENSLIFFFVQRGRKKDSLKLFLSRAWPARKARRDHSISSWSWSQVNRKKIYIEILLVKFNSYLLRFLSPQGCKKYKLRKEVCIK